jgi:hypothetical protein
MNQPHSPTLWPNYPVPERPDYRPYPARMDRLPYVKHHRNPAKCSNWAVAPPDYGTACARGREYAAHLAIYLSQNPSWVGSNILNGIAEDMDFNDPDTKGFWVGFFAFLEIRIYRSE